MRDFRDAKTMAHALRDALQVKAVDTSHSECLELVAKAFGYENWNVLSAKIEAARLREAQALAPVPVYEQEPKKAAYHCSFCGKSRHDVRILIAGPTVFICDECVGACNHVLDDQEIFSLLDADDEAGHQAYPAAVEHFRQDAIVGLCPPEKWCRISVDLERLDALDFDRCRYIRLAAKEPGFDASGKDLHLVILFSRRRVRTWVGRIAEPIRVRIDFPLVRSQSCLDQIC